jgi:hypothetical protein
MEKLIDEEDVWLKPLVNDKIKRRIRLVRIFVNLLFTGGHGRCGQGLNFC